MCQGSLVILVLLLWMVGGRGGGISPHHVMACSTAAPPYSFGAVLWSWRPLRPLWV